MLLSFRSYPFTNYQSASFTKTLERARDGMGLGKDLPNAMKDRSGWASRGDGGLMRGGLLWLGSGLSRCDTTLVPARLSPRRFPATLRRPSAGAIR